MEEITLSVQEIPYICHSLHFPSNPHSVCKLFPRQEGLLLFFCCCFRITLNTWTSVQEPELQCKQSYFSQPQDPKILPTKRGCLLLKPSVTKHDDTPTS